MQIKSIKTGCYQILTFSLVGIINTGIHYSVFLIFYKLFSVNYLTGSGLGYCCGLTNSYIMNRRFTFKVSSNSSMGEGARFVAVNAVALLINLVLMKVFVQRFGVFPEMAQVIAIVGSYCTNFFGNKFWTFRENIA